MVPRQNAPFILIFLYKGGINMDVKELYKKQEQLLNEEVTI